LRQPDAVRAVRAEASSPAVAVLLMSKPFLADRKNQAWNEARKIRVLQFSCERGIPELGLM
jgi:hypothetical protein